MSFDPNSDATFFIASTPLAVRYGLRDILMHPAMTDLSEADLGSAQLVLAEALNNIVEHAYDTPDGQMELRLRRSAGQLYCDIFDDGIAMPNGILPAGLAQQLGPDHDLPEGSFGWFLIRTLTTNLNYARIDARNHLSFQLNIEQ